MLGSVCFVFVFFLCVFFFQAEDGIRDRDVTGVQTCAFRSPSVFTIFRFAAYLNLVQELTVLFGFAPCGSSFSLLLWKSQVFTITVRHIGFFSASLPIISDYLSPDHISCMEGGVSSAVAACREFEERRVGKECRSRWAQAQ